MTELTQMPTVSAAQKHARKRSFLYQHSLSIASICILIL